MATKIKTAGGLVDVDFRIKTLSGLIQVALHGKASGGIVGYGGPSYTLPTYSLIDLFPNTTGYTFSANTTSADYGSAGAGEGNVRLTGNGTAVTMFARKLTAASLTPANMGVIAWMVKRIGGSYNGLQATMTRSASTGTVTFTDTTTALRSGRRWLAADQSEFGTFTAGANGTVQYQVSVNQAASYNADAVVGPMYYQAAGRPTILFTFDDVREEQINNVLPLMSARGMKATAYSVKNFTGSGSPRMTLANLQTLYAAGWDIGTNTQADVAITSFADDATTVADLQAAKDWLVANGMPRAKDHMALSNGTWNEARVAALEAAGMKTARTTFGAGLYTRFGFGDLAMTLPANTCTGQTLVALKALVDSAILRGTTQIFYLHDVSGAPTGLGTDITLFTDLIDYVKTKVDANLLDVLTISELWNRDHANTAPI